MLYYLHIPFKFQEGLMEILKFYDSFSAESNRISSRNTYTFIKITSISRLLTHEKSQTSNT